MAEKQKSSGVLLGAAILVLAALAAYSDSFRVPLIFDDDGSIAKNPAIRHLWPIWSALRPPPGGMPVSGRPLLNLSFAVNYALGGLGVWGYHALNLAIHIGAGLALFGVLRRTFRDGLPAFSAALLWTLHPLQTESVTYLSQRAESLMGLFYLLTLYFFIRAAEEPMTEEFFTGRSGRSGSKTLGTRPDSQPSNPNIGTKACFPIFPTFLLKKHWQILSVVCCLLGMATKEVMVTAPIVVLLYDRTFVSGSFRAAWRARRAYYIGLGGTWILLAALVAGSGGRGGTAGFAGPISWHAYALTQLRAIAHYLRLAFWPEPLVFYYGTPVGGSAVQLLVGAGVVGSLLAATLWRLTRPDPGRGAGFAGACFFLALAPSSSVLPIATETIAEHRMYLPLAALAAVVFGWLYALTSKERARNWRRAALVVSLAAAGACGLLTYRRNKDYKGDLRLWRDTVAKTPDNPVAHNNLGYALLEKGDVDGAIAECRRALRLDPANAKAHANLADALVRNGRPGEAMAEYSQALRLTPDDAEVQNNLALVLARAGRFEDAIGHYREAIRLKPYLADVHNNLGLALADSGRMDEAVAEYLRALDLDTADADADYNLGNAYAAQNHLNEAEARFREAVRLRPGFFDACNNLGDALARQGFLPEAVACYREAIRLHADFPEAHENLGTALSQMGNVKEAVGEFRAAARLNPGDPALHNNLGWALAQLGLVSEARREFEEALRLKPDDAEARANLARLGR